MSEHIYAVSGMIKSPLAVYCNSKFHVAEAKIIRHMDSGQFEKQRQIFPYRNEKAKVRLKYPGTCTILSEHSTTSYTKSKLSINMQYYPGVHIANEVCISKKWGTTWISETNGISSRHSTNVVVHLTKFP